VDRRTRFILTKNRLDLTFQDGSMQDKIIRFFILGAKLNCLFHMVLFKTEIVQFSFLSFLWRILPGYIFVILVLSLPHTCRLDSGDSFLSHPASLRTVNQ